MCDSREGKFVVPSKPAASMGWWIGQMLGQSCSAKNLSGQQKVSHLVNVLWVQNPEHVGPTTISAADLNEFDTLDEAQGNLREKGITV